MEIAHFYICCCRNVTNIVGKMCLNVNIFIVCGFLVLEKLKLYSSYELVKNASEYLFRTSEIVLIKVETNFNFEGILTV